LFFGAAIREGDGYRAVVEPVVTDLSGPDAEIDLTAKWVARLETRVRRHPEQYFWFHRRWKTAPEDAGSGSGTVEPAER
jgi:KDO2-lipid IV(A) lauroyltransferase